VESLIAFGVDTVFGLPGDGINGIMEALRQRQDEIRFIQVRHEEAAAFMACGYALANAGHDTRSLQAWLGHRNIQHTVRYTELTPYRFKDFWRT